MKLLKILSIVGILASLFLFYVGFGVQELKASAYPFGSGCSCSIGADVKTIPIIIYALGVFFLILSIVGLKSASQK